MTKYKVRAVKKGFNFSGTISFDPEIIKDAPTVQELRKSFKNRLKSCRTSVVEAVGW